MAELPRAIHDLEPRGALGLLPRDPGALLDRGEEALVAPDVVVGIRELVHPTTLIRRAAVLGNARAPQRSAIWRTDPHLSLIHI